MTNRLARWNREQENVVGFSTQQERIEWAVQRGKSWYLPFEAIDPTTGDDYFVYLKNEGPLMLEIIGITISSTVTGLAELTGVTGIAAGGQTARTPVNRRVGNSVTPKVTFETDPDITGLTSTGILQSFGLLASAGVYWAFKNGIWMPFNTAVAISWVETTGVLDGGFHLIEVPAADVL